MSGVVLESEAVEYMVCVCVCVSLCVCVCWRRKRGGRRRAARGRRAGRDVN